jgi:hypothetical protein
VHISAKEGVDAEHGKKGLFVEKQALYAAFGQSFAAYNPDYVLASHDKQHIGSV